MTDWWPVLAGPFAGSALGVLVRRLPRGQPIALDRSKCEACGHVLGAAELVPLLSFAVLRGQCRHCGAAIGRFHPTIEAAATGVALWAVLASADAGEAWTHCALGWTLLAAAWIDWDHFRLPDVLTLPLLLGGLGATWWADPDAVFSHAAAAAVAHLLFQAVAWTFRALRGRDGLGEGDAKLLAAGGAWVGLEGLPAVVLGGALLGIAAILLLRRMGRMGLDEAVPFGPYLALAIWAVRLHGG